MNVLKARESKCNLISWYHMYCTISPTESASFCLIFCFHMSACSQRNSFYFICCACHTSVCTKDSSQKHAHSSSDGPHILNIQFSASKLSDILWSGGFCSWRILPFTSYLYCILSAPSPLTHRLKPEIRRTLSYMVFTY